MTGDERQQDAEHSEKEDAEVAGGSKDAGKQDYGDQFLPVDAPDRAFADVSHSVKKDRKEFAEGTSLFHTAGCVKSCKTQ